MILFADIYIFPCLHAYVSYIPVPLFVFTYVQMYIKIIRCTCDHICLDSCMYIYIYCFIETLIFAHAFYILLKWGTST